MLELDKVELGTVVSTPVLQSALVVGKGEQWNNHYSGPGGHQIPYLEVYSPGQVISDYRLSDPLLVDLHPSPETVLPQLKAGYASDEKARLITGAACTSGADPEIFAVDADGVVIPAFTYLPPKEAGLPLPADRYRSTAGSAFYDGFQAEFTVAASSCHGFLTDYVRWGLQKVWREAQKVNPSARLTIHSVVPIPRNIRKSVDPAHMKLGCSPSKNVYNEPPLAVPAPEDLESRFAGAHMHFGSGDGKKISDEVLHRTVRFLDAVAGVASVALGEGYNCPERRRFYGRAGEYRFHQYVPYGSSARLEYRVPDTVILSHPAIFNLMWDLTRVVWRMGMAGLNFLWDASEEDIRTAINDYDVKLARQILTNNLPMFRKIITKANPQWGCSDKDYVESSEKAFFGGIGSIVRVPDDVVGNWMLEAEDREVAANYLGGTASYDIQPTDKWIMESFARKPDFWPTGKIWSSAAINIAKGERV